MYSVTVTMPLGSVFEPDDSPFDTFHEAKDYTDELLRDCPEMHTLIQRV